MQITGILLIMLCLLCILYMRYTMKYKELSEVLESRIQNKVFFSIIAFQMIENKSDQRQVVRKILENIYKVYNYQDTAVIIVDIETDVMDSLKDICDRLKVNGILANVCYGVGSYPTDGISAKSILNMASKRLYLIKLLKMAINGKGERYYGNNGIQRSFQAK